MLMDKRQLQEIIGALGPRAFIPPDMADVCISGISVDSREVKQGHLFVAVPGTSLDGRQFIPDALEKGATALVMPRQDVLTYTEAGLPVIGVDDPRSSTGLLASAFYGNPSKKMALVGITGTNGKTTTTYLLEGIFRKAGLNPGVIGTINQRYRDTEIPSKLTTPNAIDLQKTLYRMLRQGVRAVALEVSSHALDQQRVSGCRFAVSVFTNLGRDHLDYHQDMEQYFQAKARLFLDYPSDTAVINIDDTYGRRLWKMVQGKRISYGLSPEALVRPESQHIDLEGIGARITTPRGPVAIKSRLMGRHNLYNILAAVAAAIAIGIDPRHIQSGIESMPLIPGRLDPVPAPEGIRAFVDYAHTPDALDSVLNSLTGLGLRPIICVIGCGGDRDRGKRPIMAQIAASLADVVVLTSDNPRTEDPLAILDQMSAGLRDLPPHHPATRAEVKVIPDRREAISWAAERAWPGACLLLAGKGHETYQILGNRRIDFDDREVVKDAFEAIRKKTEDRGLPLEAARIAEAIGAEVLSGDPGTKIYNISTDSRTIKEGDIFWALSGEHFDGHKFVADAIRKGAVGAVVQSHLELGLPSPVLLRVEDTLKALGDLAAWYKRCLGIKVIAITGSCGKTTTKELVFSVLERQWKVAKTSGNFNNLIGLPLSMLSVRPDDAWAVLEMGTNHPGEIARLCEISRPEIGLITTIEPAHIAGLGDIREIAGEKWGLFRALPGTGTAVINCDDPLVMEGARELNCRLVGYSLRPDSRFKIENSIRSKIAVTCLSWAPVRQGTRLDLDIADARISVDLRLIGEANVQNSVAAAAMGYALGLGPGQIREGLEAARPLPGRLSWRDLGPKYKLIDDSYNANPGSMRAALETLRSWGRGKRIAILGDMLELGDAAYRFHRDLGKSAVHAGVDVLVSVGQFAEVVAMAAQEAGLSRDRIRVFPATEDLISWIESSTASLPSPATVLIKGSRAMGLEQGTDALIRHLGGRR